MSNRPLQLKFLALLLVFFTWPSAFASPPSDSWEAWILLLRQSSKETPVRPDNKNISLELPLWVDCHLSWQADRSPEKIQIPEGLVLQSSPEQCSEQMENWVSR
jgi:hypothetical protein